tara:strand:- start:17106 stop:17828 length:723 start_codon:yes stop_codon:yes gene_type:complete
MNDVIFIGDTHGNSKAIVNALEYCNLDEDVLIHVGDFGTISQNKFGMNVSKFIGAMDRLDVKLGKRCCKLYVIRGNHDDPVCFDGKWGAEMWDNIEFLPDYSTKEINGKKYLFIGGALSVDRLVRIEEHGYYFWDKEEVDLKEDKVKKCDVLVTHTADSTSLGMSWSNINWWLHGQRDGKGDPKLLADLIAEGQKMLKIRDLCDPEYWFLGHYHQEISTNIGRTKTRVLNIDEIYEFKQN